MYISKIDIVLLLGRKGKNQSVSQMSQHSGMGTPSGKKSVRLAAKSEATNKNIK